MFSSCCLVTNALQAGAPTSSKKSELPIIAAADLCVCSPIYSQVASVATPWIVSEVIEAGIVMTAVFLQALFRPVSWRRAAVTHCQRRAFDHVRQMHMTQGELKAILPTMQELGLTAGDSGMLRTITH
jgi:hypothetical protein